MNKENEKRISKAREELRKWAVKYARCAIQEGTGGGWPCGTCMCYLLSELGVKEHNIHNHPVDRVNEVWRAILQIRGEPEA